MKNQYFGDNRDLFKYDLILQIIKAGVVAHFTFIPMLTSSVPSNKSAKSEGEQRDRSRAKAGWKNNDLRVFLDTFQDKDKRDIRKLTGFFKKQGVETMTFGDYFCHSERKEYFQEVQESLLPKSLIFVDPDIGLGEVKRPREKHILCSEVKDLYKRMDKSSILMIFQYFPRKRTQSNIQKHFYERTTRLKEIGGGLPIYIEDNEIRLFFLTKAESIRKRLSRVINNYKKCYPELRVENTED